MSARTSARFVALASRVQALVTALIFVVAGGIGAVHEATTTHVRCEHGELTHASPEAAGVTVTPTRDAVVHGMPGNGTHQHEHCLLACAEHTPSLDARPPVLASMPLVAGRVAIVIASVAEPHGGGLYRTAPKTSPPA